MKFRVLSFAILAAAGCGGGGGGGGGFSSTAPINTRVPITPITTQTTVGAAVSASLALNSFAAFKELNSVADLQIPSGTLKNKAFALEDKGYVRVLDLSGTKPVLDRQIPLDVTSPFTGGVSAGSLTIVDANTALATTSGKEAAYIFDPTTAKTSADVTKIDLTPMSATFSTPQMNSKGVSVASPMPLTFTASAVLSKGRIFVASSNLDSNFDYNPGTVVSFAYDPVTKMVGAATLSVTTGFNPTRLTRYVSGADEALLCVNAGANGATDSSIDIFDPVRSAVVASIPLGKVGAFGAVAISPDGKRGYVGSQGAAEVYEIDLSNLGPVINSATLQSLPARNLGAIKIAASTGLNFVAGVGVSASGKYVYATNFNTSELSIIDVAARKAVGSIKGFQRNGDPTKFEGTASVLAVRSGTPGVDFQGPPVFVATINLDVTSRSIPSVTSALDGVSFDRN